MLLGGLFIIKRRKLVVVSNIFGKMTVVFFYAAVAICISARDFLKENPVMLYIVCSLVLFAAISALVNYAVKYFSAIRHGNDSAMTENIAANADAR